MYELTQADMIWNRACGQDPVRTHRGDRALTDLLVLHGLAMNGGVLHAVECLTPGELYDSKAGYQFYRLDDVACLLSHARTLLETDDNLEFHESQLDRQYADIIPDDASLFERFREHLRANPSEYAPLRAQDVV